jgi:hypothetical protein
MVRWVIIIFLVAVCWTAYEKGKDYVDDYGALGLLHATEKNLWKTWDDIVSWCSGTESNFEKNHPEFWCGKKGCDKK